MHGVNNFKIWWEMFRKAATSNIEKETELY